MSSTIKTLTAKYMLPLLFMNSEYAQYATANYGLINAYSGDINKPQLEKHLLLVYKNDKSAKKYLELWNNLPSHQNFYSRYSLKINNEFYDVYAFVVGYGKNAKAANHLFAGDYDKIDYTTKVRILKYLGCDMMTEEHKFLFDSTTKDKITQEIIPEQDPPNDLMFKTESHDIP